MNVDLLPLDVFVLICEYLRPNEVLRLGYVNKRLHDLVNTRTVWIAKMLAVIHENALFATSFPLRKMTTSELKQTACGPGRMVDRFWSKHEVSADEQPVTEEDRCMNGYTHPPLRPLPNKSAYEIPFLHRHGMRTLGIPEGMVSSRGGDLLYEKVCLIPGGRFLACVAEKEAFIWDLGLPAQAKHFTPKIYCRWPIVGDEIFMPGPSADGKELRIVMGSMPPDNTSTSPGLLTIFHICEEVEDQKALGVDGGQEPSVKIRLSTCPLYNPLHISFFTIFGDIFVYMYRPESQFGHDRCYVVWVWDCVKNEYATWKVARPFTEVFIDNGFLCMIELPEVVGWKIPPLKPWSQHNFSDELGAFIVPPAFRIELLMAPEGHRVPNGPFAGLIGRLLDWYNISIPLRQYDGISFNSEHQNEFWTYGIYDWPDQWNRETFEDVNGIQRERYVPADTENPPYILLQHSAAFIGDELIPIGITIDPYRICEDYTVKSIVSADSKACVMVDLPERPGTRLHEDDEVDSRRPTRVILMELEVPYPVPTPNTITDVDNDSDDIDEINQPGPSTSTTETTNIDEELSTTFSTLTLEDDELTLPLPHDLKGRTDFSFDPCSGRFCYVGAGRKRIGIVDFLKWG